MLVVVLISLCLCFILRRLLVLGNGLPLSWQVFLLYWSYRIYCQGEWRLKWIFENVKCVLLLELTSLSWQLQTAINWIPSSKRRTHKFPSSRRIWMNTTQRQLNSKQGTGSWWTKIVFGSDSPFYLRLLRLTLWKNLNFINKSIFIFNLRMACLIWINGKPMMNWLRMENFCFRRESNVDKTKLIWNDNYFSSMTVKFSKSWNCCMLFWRFF